MKTLNVRRVHSSNHKSAFSLKMGLQHQRGMNATLIFFSLFVVAESAKPCRRWTVAQHPSSPCAFRDQKQWRQQDKRLQRCHFLICQQIHPPAPNGREKKFSCFQDQGLNYHCEVFPCTTDSREIWAFGSRPLSLSCHLRPCRPAPVLQFCLSEGKEGRKDRRKLWGLTLKWADHWLRFHYP